MKITYLLAVLLVLPSLATPTTAHEQTHNGSTRAQHREPRGCRSLVERRMHDRPRPERVRRAYVDLWQQRRAIPKRILIRRRLTPSAPNCSHAIVPMLHGQNVKRVE